MIEILDIIIAAIEKKTTYSSASPADGAVAPNTESEDWLGGCHLFIDVLLSLQRVNGSLFLALIIIIIITHTVYHRLSQPEAVKP